MKKVIIFGKLLTVLALTFVSCDATKSPEPSSQNSKEFTTQSVESLQNRLRTAPKTYTVTDGTITTEKGTKIYVPQNSLIDKNGFPVAFPVDIDIKEVYDAGDMIRNGISTTSNGELLVSGGQFKISASKNGEELAIGEFDFMTVEVPTADGHTEMKFFSGGTEEQPNWVEFKDTSSYVSVTDDYYQVSFSKLEWINCDYFYRSNGPTQSVELGCTYDGNTIANSAAQMFIHIPEINSVVSFYDGSISGISVGLEAELIIVAQNVNNELFVASKDITIVDGDNSHVLELRKVQESELDTFLDEL